MNMAGSSILPIFAQRKWGGGAREAGDGEVRRILPLHPAICDGAVPLPICAGAKMGRI